MDFIILNSDGSLQKQSLTRYIQQGSHGVDEIFIGWVNATSSQTLQAVFTLPNQLTNTELGVFEEDYEYEPGETMSGWVITLTENQTRYNGALMVSARIILNGIVQVAYPFALIINETGVRPETDSGITLAQLDSYLLNIQNLVAGAVRQNTDAALSSTSENPVQNKVITIALENFKKDSYRKVDITEYPTLQDFLDSEGEEGYLYLYPVVPNDEDEGYYRYIWEENAWVSLGTTVIDIDNMMTTDTDQDVSGSKTFDNLKDVRFKAVNSGHYFYIRANGDVFHIGAYGVATNLTLDNYLTKFIPAATGQQELGSNDNKWKSLFLSHYVAWGNNVLIGKDSSNRFYVTGSDGNVKIKVGQNETYFANHVEPDANNTYNLGRSGMKWNITYTRYLNDDSVSIAVSDIATKIDTTETIDLGTFDANGEITYDIDTLKQDLSHLGYDSAIHGMYMLTYLYAQAIIYLDETQITTAASNGHPVRAPMPVVYDALHSYSVPGNIKVQKSGTNLVFKVSDGSVNAAQGQHMYIIPTNLVK